MTTTTTENAQADKPTPQPTPAYVSSERAELMTKIWLDEAEANRRERPSVDCWPLPVETATVIDYGRSGQAIELALSHLRESVPNGQRRRTEAASAALMIAVKQHVDWLRQKGYNI